MGGNSILTSLTGAALVVTGASDMSVGHRLSLPVISTIWKVLCLLSTWFVTVSGEATGAQRALQPCEYIPADVLGFRDIVRKCAQENPLHALVDTSSGAYVLHDTDGKKLALVKPVDERNLGPQNRVEARRQADLSDEDQYQQNFYPGHPAKRQVVAKRLD
ncbi:MAG: hypothetical protein KGI83_06410, partial [Verrucomicrobiota bacterium]|nr:hypothetical protein [Verrucomicrobiota bacterium]